jgi:hypothetical protein
MLLALHSSAVAAQAAVPTDPPQPAEKVLLEAEFYAAIGAEGHVYRQFRDRVLQRGPAVEPFLTDKAQNGKTWQERTMAWILLERLQKKAEVSALLDAKPRVPFHPSRGIRIPRYRDDLAAQAEATPMVLVESAWKGNRLVWERQYMAAAYSVAALGVLKERRATPVLVDYLQRHLTLVTAQQASPDTVEFACEALGALEDPAAVPELLHTCVAGPKGMGACGFQALAKCLGPGSIGMVQAAAIYLRGHRMKKPLEELVKEKKAEFAARAKPRGARKK